MIFIFFISFRVDRSIGYKINTGAPPTAFCCRVKLRILSVFHINNCPTRCNTKQSIYYSASSLYMFRLSTTPIIRSTQKCNYSLRYWSYFLYSYLPLTWVSWPRWREVAAQKIWLLPEAVVTVLCTPVDGCVWHPKHVQWTCRIINRLLCVASRWTIINIQGVSRL